MPEIVKTELSSQGIIELPLDPEPGGRVRKSARRVLRRLHLKAPRQPKLLNLFAQDMSAYRFVSAKGAVAIVPFHNALLEDSAVPIEGECRKLALLELERAERNADMQRPFPGVVSRAVAGGSDDYAGSE